jgi:nicotinate-nucleotide pyrophosphorylase (carboxylating)
METYSRGMDVRAALAEDLGSGDVTSQATVPEDARGVATITQKAPGVVFGVDACAAVFSAVDPSLVVERLDEEGEWRESGPVVRVTGSTRSILGAERTALNVLQQLSGVATLTAKYVRAVEGTGVKILDTRKTVPGLRLEQKAAVKAGGGENHRIGLYDMVLIKENHVAAAGGITNAVRAARELAPDLGLEVEVRNAEEIAEALDAGATHLLLDNMGPDALRAAVRQVDGRAKLEASGGITLETVREHAVEGLDWISVGALTHSAPALDLSLILEPLP